MTHEATVRMVTADSVTYLALPDVAALLLDTADTLDDNPGLSGAGALRSIATGLAKYGA
jgi:hypothetical protein